MKKGLIISFKAFVDFIPLIFLWSIPNNYGLKISLIASFILVIVKLFTKNLGLMSKVVFLYLLFTNIFYSFFKINYFFEKRDFISYTVLTLMCIISIKLYRPFTIDASKKSYTSIQNSALFIEMNIIITGIFGICYGINSIIAFFEVPILRIVSIILTTFAILSSIILPSFMPDV